MTEITRKPKPNHSTGRGPRVTASVLKPAFRSASKSGTRVGMYNEPKAKKMGIRYQRGNREMLLPVEAHPDNGIIIPRPTMFTSTSPPGRLLTFVRGLE